MRQICVAAGLFLAVSFGGCTLTVKAPPVAAPAIPAQERISLGMTRDAVTAVMSRPVTVGFEIDPATGTSHPIEVGSLFSSEILSLGAETYLVDYYIVDAEKAQVQIADADLFPVVFRNDLLVAKGQDGLKAIKEKSAGQ